MEVTTLRCSGEIRLPKLISRFMPEQRGMESDNQGYGNCAAL